MTAEQRRRLTSYDELGAYRHLVVSERLRSRRRELGLTQKEVEEWLIRLGVPLRRVPAGQAAPMLTPAANGD